MIVDCYSMDLYCDNPQCNRRESHNDLAYPFPDQYIGRNRNQCVRDAKKAGWLIRGLVAICPFCSKHGVKPSKDYEGGWDRRGEFDALRYQTTRS